MVRADRAVNSAAALREASGKFGLRTTKISTKMASTLAEQDQFAPPPPAPLRRRMKKKKKDGEDVVGSGRGDIVGGKKRGPASYENMAVEVGKKWCFRQVLSRRCSLHG